RQFRELMDGARRRPSLSPADICHLPQRHASRFSIETGISPRTYLMFFVLCSLVGSACSRRYPENAICGQIWRPAPEFLGCRSNINREEYAVRRPLRKAASILIFKASRFSSKLVF